MSTPPSQDRNRLKIIYPIFRRAVRPEPSSGIEIIEVLVPVTHGGVAIQGQIISFALFPQTFSGQVGSPDLRASLLFSVPDGRAPYPFISGSHALAPVRDGGDVFLFTGSILRFV